MNPKQIAWAIILSATHGVEFQETNWRRITKDSQTFVARFGWKIVAILPDGSEATGIED